MKRYRGSLLTLVELLVVTAIILFLSFKMLQVYFNTSPCDVTTAQTLQEQGIDTRSQKAMLDSAREKVQGINRQLIDRTKGFADTE